MTAIRQLNWPGRLGVGSLVGGAVWFGVLALSTRQTAPPTRLPTPRRPGVGSLVGGAVWFGVLALSTRLEAQLQTMPLSYTAGQADQGQAAYVEHCASCHGQNLDDGAYGPPLKGNDFRQKC